MAAAPDTMAMALSPGLDALCQSPISVSAESLHLTDYLDFGTNATALSSPPASPASPNTPAPGAAAMTAKITKPALTSQPATDTTDTNSSSSSSSSCSCSSNSNSNTNSNFSTNTPQPPPPGSAPEVVFRYYLKLELRKMGSPADDATIDRYVHQHYNAFLKAIDSGKQPSNTTAAKPAQTAITASNNKAFPAPTDDDDDAAPTSSIDSPSSNLAMNTGAKPAQSAKMSTNSRFESDATLSNPQQQQGSSQTPPPSATSAPTDFTVLHSISSKPHVQPFKIPPVDDLGFVLAGDHSPLTHPLYESIDPSFVHFAGTPPISKDVDAMSEDGAVDATQPDATQISSFTFEEDSKDELAPLVSSMRFSSASKSDRGRSSSSEPASQRGGVPPSIRDSAAANLRPTAEEYRALSSKEKRQLRNKISAKNFRERRKEYITHLEDEISDRDATINALRQELSKMSVHNKKLEEEVKTLQARSLSQADVQKILDALQNVTVPPINFAFDANANSIGSLAAPTSVLRTSAPYDVTLSSAGGGNFANSRPSTPSSPRPAFVCRGTPTSSMLPQHNPRKDLPATAGPGASSASNSQQQPWNRGGPTVAASA